MISFVIKNSHLRVASLYLRWSDSIFLLPSGPLLEQRHYDQVAVDLIIRQFLSDEKVVNSMDVAYKRIILISDGM